MTICDTSTYTVTYIQSDLMHYKNEGQENIDKLKRKKKIRTKTGEIIWVM